MAAAASNMKTRCGLRSLSLLVVESAEAAAGSSSGGLAEMQFWAAIGDLIRLRYPAAIDGYVVETEREWHRLGEFMGFRSHIATRRIEVASEVAVSSTTATKSTNADKTVI